jgi:hypothetical protein
MMMISARPNKVRGRIFFNNNAGFNFMLSPNRKGVFV